MILVFHILFLLFITIYLYFRSGSSLLRPHYFPGLMMKLSAGIALGVIYFYHYQSGDTLVFNEVAIDVTDLSKYGLRGYFNFLFIQPDPNMADIYPVLKEPRSLFFIRIISVLYLFTSGNYWISGLYLSFLSFWASWKLANALTIQNYDLKIPALIGLIYLPTFVFWTSGILKESVAWICLALLTLYYLQYLLKGDLSIGRLLIWVLLFYILWRIKYYYAAIFMVTVVTSTIYWLTSGHLKDRRYFLPAFIAVSILVAGLILLAHPNLRPDRIFSVIQENHNILSQRSDPAQQIGFFRVGDPHLQFVVNVPIAMAGGLFMPLFWQGNNLLVSLTGIINLLILLFFTGKVYGLLRYEKYRMTPLEFFLLAYIVLLAVLLAYSTPNFGTLERYKISYIAYFTVWILYDNHLLKRILKLFKH